MEAQGLRKSDRVVRSLATAGGRTCARPGCPAPAQATLMFVYEAKEARLGALLPERDPAGYDLCTGHADRTSPPFGWSMSDQRPPASDAPAVDLADEDRTVAVISAALRAVPTTPDPVPVVEDPPSAVQPRRVLAARERPVPNAQDADVAVLTEALEQMAGAEVEVALAEIHGLAQVDPADAPDVDDWDDDAPLSPEGHAQAW